MAGRTYNEERRAVAQRQECRGRPIPAKSAAEEFGGQQELKQEAQADRIAGEDAQGEASGESVEANARRKFQNLFRIVYRQAK